MLAIPPGSAAPGRQATAAGGFFRGRRRPARALAFCLAIGLVLFHGLLLWQRIASTTLLEPLVALRWSAAALMLAGFVYLRHAGASVVRGDKAQVLWLLVLLLHAGMVPAIDGHRPLAEPGLLLAVALWGFALRAILGEPARRAGGGVTRFERFLAAPRSPRPPNLARFLAPLSPRPPPVA